MKNNELPADKPKRGFNPDKFRRHYVSAVESDDTAITEEEKGNLGRIFTFLLLLHVFLIGAVVLYNLVADKPKTEMSSVASLKPREAAKVDPVAAAAALVALEDMDEHFVASGQNLQDIADVTGATKDQLIALNHLNENPELFVGRKLLFPKKKAPEPAAPLVAAVPVPAPAPAAPAHVAAAGPAKSGDGFAAVEPTRAASPDPTPKALAAKTTLDVADKLPEAKPKDAKPAASVVKPKDPEPESKPIAKVTPPPVKKETVAVTKPKEVEAPKPAVKKAGGTHEVKPKETFYSIARRYGVNVNELMKVNGIKNPSALRDGTKLKIPANG